MQTFLPHAGLVDSVRCLDRARLGKQRVEVKQIAIALGVTVGPHVGRPDSGWRHHPAVRMWRGYEYRLLVYGWFVCWEWRNRGYKDTLRDQFDDALRLLSWCDVPPWVGSPEFHARHRSMLLAKDPEWYGQFGWSEEPGLGYIWPVGKEVTA